MQRSFVYNSRSLSFFLLSIILLNSIIMSRYAPLYAQQEKIESIIAKDTYLDQGEYNLYVLSRRNKVFRIDTQSLEIADEYDYSSSISLPQHRMIHCNNKLFIILFNSEQIEIGIFNNVTNTVLLLAFSTVYIPSNARTIFAYDNQIGMILANGSLIFFSPETKEFVSEGSLFPNVVRVCFSARNSTLMTLSNNPTNLSFYNLKNHQMIANYMDSSMQYGYTSFQTNSNLFSIGSDTSIFFFDTLGNLFDNVTYSYSETGLGFIESPIIEHNGDYYFFTNYYFCKLINRSIVKLFSSEILSYRGASKMLSDNSTNQIYITSSSDLYVYFPSLNETIEIQYTYTINTHSEPIGLYWIPIIIGCMILIGGTVLLIKTYRR